MADGVDPGSLGPPWPVEMIPDEHCVYLRVPRVQWNGGQIEAGCFREPQQGRKDNTSTDWDRYRSPHITRADSPRQPPEAYGVVSLNVGRVREVPEQSVEHDPLDDNRAHCLIIGPKKAGEPKHRLLLARLATVCVNLKGPVEVPWRHAPNET